MASSQTRAQDATWLANPGSGDFNTAANWNPAAVPTGTAFFDASNTTNLSFSADTTVGGFTFNAGASNYTFSTNHDLSFAGGNGITVNGGSANITINTGASNTGASLYFFGGGITAGVTITNNEFLNFRAGSTAGSANITNNDLLEFSTGSTAGTATITNNGGIYFDSDTTAANATITNNGSVYFGSNSTAGSATVTTHGGRVVFYNAGSGGTARFITQGGGIFDLSELSSAGTSAGSIEGAGSYRLGSKNLTVGSNGLSTEVSGVIADGGLGGGTGGSLTKVGTGTLTLSGNNTYTGGTVLNGGTLSLQHNNALGTGTLTILGSTVDYGAGITIANAIDLQSNATLNVNAGTATQAGAIGETGGSFGITKTGAGTLTLSGNNTYTGGTVLNGGTLSLQHNNALGTGTLTILGSTVDYGAGITIANAIDLQNNATLNVNAGTATQAGAIGETGGSFGITKTGAGTLVLPGVNTYTGATTINGGTLLVNGTIVGSSTTVNAGGTLAGIGTVGATTVGNGGVFAPGSGVAGTSMTVNGALAFNAGSTYRVNVNPAAASSTTVNGAATLTGGTVNAVFAPGSYMANSYTILSASSGIGGTTFAGLTTANLPSNFSASLDYGANTVVLNLTAALGTGTDLSQSQQNVAAAIDNFFNGGGTLPPGFVTVFGLSGPALAGALTQLSGEGATGIQPASHLSMGLFLNAMLDPFVAGRTGGIGSAMAYAPEPREAYAASFPVKASPMIVPTFEQRWSVWGAAYGGKNRTDGDAAVGSNDLSARTGGFAAGADYRVSPDMVIGAAVAIGETKWSVAGVGGGNSNVAQVGGYASTRIGAGYLSVAVAGAWHDAETDRVVTVAGTDRLEADFDAQAFGARVEAGRRFGALHYGITPYAAVQVQRVHTPAYSERATQGSNQFALSYASQSATDTRSELGAWLDTRHLLSSGATLVMRARAAWVHDFNPESRINAAFQTLPGASFTVDGAAAPKNAALTSAVAELRLPSGWVLIGKFDGEFSNRSHTLAGTGTLKYAW